jgi:hypothetical protein
LIGDDQPGSFGLFQRVEQIFFFFLGKRCKEIKAEHPADAGRGRQDALRCFADAVDAASEHKPNRFRYFDLSNLDLGKPFACFIG